jgi:hypothetical protein
LTVQRWFGALVCIEAAVGLVAAAGCCRWVCGVMCEWGIELLLRVTASVGCLTGISGNHLRAAMGCYDPSASTGVDVKETGM